MIEEYEKHKRLKQIAKYEKGGRVGLHPMAKEHMKSVKKAKKVHKLTSAKHSKEDLHKAHAHMKAHGG